MKRYYILHYFDPANVGSFLLVSLLGLILTSPILLVTALAIRMEDHGPVFYRQKRATYGGRVFEVYKFRSMRAQAGDIHVSATKGDQRITRVGRIIRKFRIDELPQLFNVLKGEMSIVGPRPALPREVAQYTAYEWQRLYVTPGLSCYWQIAPHRDQLSFEEWMDLDIKYVHERSFPVDWKIIFRTFRSMLFGHGE